MNFQINEVVKIKDREGVYQITRFWKSEKTGATYVYFRNLPYGVPYSQLIKLSKK